MGGPDLFDLRESLWSLFDQTEDELIGALKACWLLRAAQLLARTEVISSNGLADPLGMEILEL